MSKLTPGEAQKIQFLFLQLKWLSEKFGSSSRKRLLIASTDSEVALMKMSDETGSHREYFQARFKINLSIDQMTPLGPKIAQYTHPPPPEGTAPEWTLGK